MNRDLTELLDPELKRPIKLMLSQMPPMTFDNMSDARAISRQMTAVVNVRMPVIHGVSSQDRVIPGLNDSQDVAI